MLPRILGNKLSHERAIVDLSQLTFALGWGCPLHAWLATVNLITWARSPNTRKSYKVRGMHNHIPLHRYIQNITPITMWFKILIVHSVHIHVSQFREERTSYKAQVKHVLEANMRIFVDRLGKTPLGPILSHCLWMCSMKFSDFIEQCIAVASSWCNGELTMQRISVWISEVFQPWFQGHRWQILQNNTRLTTVSTNYRVPFTDMV